MSKKIQKHLSKDPIMKQVVKDHEILYLANSMTVFHELVKNIVYQQISVKAAASIHARFIKFIGTDDFTPEDLLLYSQEELRTAGLSTQKSGYILNIGQFFSENQIEESTWEEMSDQDIIDMLTQIKGVGEWTAQMILMIQLLRPDVFPVKDLGIQIAMKKLYNLKSEKKELLKEMEEIAESWKPFRSSASLYLWAWKRAN